MKQFYYYGLTEVHGVKQNSEYQDKMFWRFSIVSRENYIIKSKGLRLNICGTTIGKVRMESDTDMYAVLTSFIKVTEQAEDEVDMKYVTVHTEDCTLLKLGCTCIPPVNVLTHIWGVNYFHRCT